MRISILILGQFYTSGMFSATPPGKEKASSNKLDDRRTPPYNWLCSQKLIHSGGRLGVDESLTIYKRITKIFHPDSARVVLRCRSILTNVVVSGSSMI